MKNNDLTKIILKIIEKETSRFVKIFPNDLLKRIENQLGPEIDKIIEKGGYIKKEKYDFLNKIVKDLEKRISDLEKKL